MNSQSPINDEILDLEGASKLTGYSKHTLYGKSSRGEIPVSNTGKKLFFFRSDLIDYIKAHKKTLKTVVSTAA